MQPSQSVPCVLAQGNAHKVPLNSQEEIHSPPEEHAAQHAPPAAERGQAVGRHPHIKHAKNGQRGNPFRFDFMLK